MIWYCDSSALVKRYVREAGSIWFRQQLSRYQLISSTLSIAEVPSALVRRRREGIRSQFEFYRGRRRFDRHVKAGSYVLVPTPLDVIKQGALLLYRAPLSALDAIHLATALRFLKARGVEQSHFYFVTADDQLQRAAKAEGLQTENPITHP